MILSLGSGEASYIPDAMLGAASDEVDITLVPLLQLYAGHDLPWDVLSAIAETPQWCSLYEILPGHTHEIPMLAEQMRSFVEFGLVEEEIAPVGPRYRLLDRAGLRKLVGFLSAPALQ